MRQQRDASQRDEGREPHLFRFVLATWLAVSTPPTLSTATPRCQRDESLGTKEERSSSLSFRARSAAHRFCSWNSSSSSAGA